LNTSGCAAAGVSRPSLIITTPARRCPWSSSRTVISERATCVFCPSAVRSVIAFTTDGSIVTSFV
jgi:hypothetical protein